MQRFRAVLAAGGAVALLVAPAPSAPGRNRAAASKAVKHPPRATVLTIGGPTTSPPIARGFLGLSFEYWAVPDYAGQDPRRTDPVFLQLIRNLAGGSAPNLRIGGVTTDNTWSPFRGAARPAGVNFALTHRWIAVIGKVAAKLGARLTLGINFEADSPLLAAAETRALVAGIGRRRVAALELGNEPELYGVFTWGVSGAPGRPSSWNFAAFDRDYAHIAGALPRIPLAGPTLGQRNWFGFLGRFLSDQPRVAVATLHRYPLQLCFVHPDEPNYPTIANLLAPSSSRSLADSVATSVKVAHAHHVPLRIDEINTISCGDVAAVAQSFASALWSLDTMFELARVGVDGVNIHTFPGATYQLFTLASVHGRWRAVVEPDYYGLEMFAQAAPAGSRLLNVSPTGHGLEVWATRAPDRTIRVVVINQGDRARVVAVRAAGLGTGTLERLQAPSLLALGRVTLAGQSFGAATGTLTGHLRMPTVIPSAGEYRFKVASASAVMLTLPAR
jgi:hypothetical protein